MRYKVPKLVREKREIVGGTEKHVTIHKRNRAVRIPGEDYEVCIWMEISLEDEPVKWVQTGLKKCGLREAKKICQETFRT